MIVGSLLLLFGLEWLCKGVLRVAAAAAQQLLSRVCRGSRRERGARSAAGRHDWAAFGLAVQGVLLEGLEVGLIVLALGAAPGHLSPRCSARRSRSCWSRAPLALRRPLQQVPETQIKLGMGVALTAFGTYFTVQGLGAHWPLAELAEHPLPPLDRRSPRPASPQARVARARRLPRSPPRRDRRLHPDHRPPRRRADRLNRNPHRAALRERRPHPPALARITTTAQQHPARAKGRTRSSALPASASL